MNFSGKYTIFQNIEYRNIDILFDKKTTVQVERNFGRATEGYAADERYHEKFGVEDPKDSKNPWDWFQHQPTQICQQPK